MKPSSSTTTSMRWRSSRLRRLATPVVVAGGGFTGIETATEMPGRLRAYSSATTYRDNIRVVIVERGELIAPQTGDNPRPVIARGNSRRRRGSNPRRGCHGLG